MAGQPKMQALIRAIEAREGGEEWVFDQMADGATIGEISDQLGISRRMLYTWRDRLGHKERLRAKWSAAMTMSAEAQLEKATHQFDRLDRLIEVDPDTGREIDRIPTSAEVTLATGRAKYRMWLAARRDPEQFGDQGGAQVNVQLNVGDMHLDALKAVKAREALPPAEIPVIEAEVIDG